MTHRSAQRSFRDATGQYVDVIKAGRDGDCGKALVAYRRASENFGYGLADMHSAGRPDSESSRRWRIAKRLRAKATVAVHFCANRK